jgi:hypothetical protein
MWSDFVQSWAGAFARVLGSSKRLRTARPHTVTDRAAKLSAACLKLVEVESDWLAIGISTNALQLTLDEAVLQLAAQKWAELWIDAELGTMHEEVWRANFATPWSKLCMAAERCQ